MGTVNEDYLDALVRHQVYLMRLSEGVRKQVEKILNKTEADIADKIKARLLGHNGLSTGGIKKLQSLEKYIQTVRYKAWDEIDEEWLEQLIALAKEEVSLTAVALATVSPVILDLTLPAPGLLREIATSTPFEGRTLKQWSKALREEDVKRISDQIKIGMIQGQTSKEIASRIIGTARLKGRDGVTEITRRNAATITRTAINHIGNAAKREFYKENADMFSGEQFVATLDSRTTAVCRANDGKIFPVGKGPLPPLHWGCRSLRVAVIDGEVIGNRPAKPTTEKQLLREYTSQNGLKSTTDRDALPRGHKTAFDKFAATRVRELTGIVPAKTSYQTWLTSQSKEFQDDVLGKTKAQLFRTGKLPLDKFVNRKGDELSLSELAARETSAFKAAGLNPEDYL